MPDSTRRKLTSFKTKLTDPVWLAFIYGIGSFFIGPAIPLLNYSSSPGSGDCYDPIWDGSSLKTRNDVIHHVQVVNQIEASVMVIIGIVLLCIILRRYSSIKPHRLNADVIISLVILMICGYTALYLFESYPACEGLGRY